MERITFRCSNCSKALAIDARHAGKQVACPGCSTQLTIPNESATAPIEATSPTEETPPAVPKNPFAVDTSEQAAPPPNPSPYASSMPAYDNRNAQDQNAVPSRPASSTSMGKSLAGLAVATIVAGVFQRFGWPLLLSRDTNWAYWHGGWEEQLALWLVPSVAIHPPSTVESLPRLE